MPVNKLSLTGGGFTLLDHQDYLHLKRWKWTHHPSGYATRAKRIDGKWRTIYMHREILKPNEGFETDHINRDRLDNRRSNLRACTTSQNAHNRRLRSDNKTGVMGIWFRKDSRKWTARIVVNGQRKILGCFISKEEAAMAYQQAAQQYYG